MAPKILGTISSQDVQIQQQNTQIQQQNRQSNIPIEVQVEEVKPVPVSIEEQYELHYLNLIKNRFDAAEKGFQQFVEKYPKHQLAENAIYWLAETHYARQNYKTAAQTFLTAYRKYPKGNKAPDNLLKPRNYTRES